MRIHAVSKGAHRAFRGAAASLAAAVLGACGDVLEVDNPNNVVDEALNNPAATASIVNGAGASVIKAFNSVLAPYGAVTDELTWSGSRWMTAASRIRSTSTSMQPRSTCQKLVI